MEIKDCNYWTNIRNQASANEELVNYIENIENIKDDNKYFDMLNQKRVTDKKEWLKVLDNEETDDNRALDILLYLYDCKNYTSNGKKIAKYFKTDVGAINSYIKSFGKRIIDLLNLEEQIYNETSSRRWNIPFTTVPELNTKNVFTWKLRKELVEALVEKFDLIPKEDTIDEKVKEFIEEYPYNDYCKSIEKDIEARKYFINKFSLSKIMDMTLDEFVIGRADIDEKAEIHFAI